MKRIWLLGKGWSVSGTKAVRVSGTGKGWSVRSCGVR